MSIPIRTTYFRAIILLIVVLAAPNADAQWRQCNVWMSTVDFVVVDGANIFAGGWLGVFRSTDRGNTWAQTSVRGQVTCLALAGGTLYAACIGKLLYASSDHGTSWTDLKADSQLPDVYSFISIDAVPDGYGGSILFASTALSIYTSVDRGISWNQITFGPWRGVFRLVASRQNILVCDAKGMFLSTDQGGSWATVISPQQNPMGVWIQEGKAYASTASGLYQSTNDGKSWDFFCSSPWSAQPASFAVQGGLFFAAVGGAAIYLSTDGGQIWRIVDAWTGTRPTSFRCLALMGDTMFVGTDLSVWRRSLKEQLTSVNSSTMNVSTFTLHQNYPNPFNPTTSLEYRIANFEFVTLRIYDVLGRIVATLVNGEQSIGVHRVEFNGSALSSGMYFAELQAGTLSRTIKIVLAK